MNFKLKILLQLLLISSSVSLTLGQGLWPFRDENGNVVRGNITGTVSDYRSSTTTGYNGVRFHAGVDFTSTLTDLPDRLRSRAVYSMHTGTVFIANEAGCLNDYIRILTSEGVYVYYKHVNVATTNPVTGQPTLPLQNGNPVQVGDFLGLMVTEGGCAQHVHINSNTTGTNSLVGTTNFIYNFVNPFDDTEPPNFMFPFNANGSEVLESSGSDAVEFRTNGHRFNNVTTQYSVIATIDGIAHRTVYDKIDIISRARDKKILSNGTGGDGNNGMNSLSYQIFNSSNTQTAVTSSIENLNFNSVPPLDRAQYVFDNRSILGGVSRHVYILTNNPFNTPYDRFWNTRLRIGQVENWDIVNRAEKDARYVGEAQYPDGKYIVKVSAKDIRSQDGNAANLTQRNAPILVDNFRPYIKEIQVRKFGEIGPLSYLGKWEWNGSSLVLNSFNFNDINAVDNIWIKIIMSEPVINPEINIQSVDGSNYRLLTSVQGSNNTEFIITYNPITALGTQIMRFRATDYASNPLQSNPAQIPLRQANGVWSPVPNTTGIDANHYFNRGTFVCSNGSSGGREKSGDRTASSGSGCLYVDFAPDKTIAQVSEAIIFTPVVSGSGTITYNWNFGAGAVPATATSSGPQTVIYTTSGTKTVTLQICDNTTECITEEKVGVVTIGAPTNPGTLAVDFSVDRYAAFTGEAFQFTSTVTGATGNVTYNWSFGEGASSGIVTSPNPTVTYSTPGNKSISLVVTDAYGSVTRVRNSWLYINSSTYGIQAVIDSPCGNTELSGRMNLSATVSGGNGWPYDRYHWDFGDGTFQEILSPTSVFSSVQHYYTRAGKYTVRFTACDETGCKTVESVNCVTVPTVVDQSTLSVNFLINGNTITGPLNQVGLNRPVKLTSSSSGGGDLSSYSYRWRIDCAIGGTNCARDVRTEGPVTQEHVFTSAGDKVVKLTVYNNNISRTDPYTGYVLKVVPGLGAEGCYAEIGDVSISSTCWTASNPPQFSVPVTTSNCPIALTEVMWDGYVLPNGILDFDALSAHYGRPIDPPAFPHTSDFSFAVYQFDGVSYNRIGYKRKRFTIYGPVTANAGLDIQSCVGATVSLGVESQDGLMYTWTTNNSAPLTYLSDTKVGKPTFNAVQKGTFKYRVTVTDQVNGCIGMDDVTITVNGPEVSNGPFWAKLAEPIQLSATATGGFGNNSYSWSPTTYLNSGSSAAPSFTSSADGEYNYSVTVTDQMGCSGIGQVSVNVSSAPGNLVAQPVAYQRITLTWLDRTNNETGFVIQRSVNSSSDFVDYASVGSNATTFNDVNVNSLDTYYYQVKAVVGQSSTGFSNIGTANTGSLPKFTGQSWPFNLGSNIGVMAFCDFNNDGNVEYLVSRGSLLEIYELVNGNYNLIRTISIAPKTVYDAYPIDLDNDNDYDIVIIAPGASAQYSAHLYRNNNLVFEPLPQSFFANEISVFDSNNDNTIDLIANNSVTGAVTNKVFQGNGDFIFSSIYDLENNHVGYFSYGEISAGFDMNNDGLQDIVHLFDNGLGQVGLYKNNGSSFDFMPISSNSYTIGSIDVVDYNKDHKNDILTSLRVNLLTNLGNDTYESRYFLAGLNQQNARWGDYNMDGGMDFYVSITSSDQIFRVYENSSNDFIYHNLNTSGEFIDWVDIDGDGDLDILKGRSYLINNMGDNIVKHNTRPSQPQNLCVYFNKQEATFSWSAGSDTETLAAGLTYNLYVKQNNQFILSPLANTETGFRKVVGRGNVGQNTSWTLTLPGTGNIEWGVQTIDNQYIGSTFAKNVLSPVLPVCGPITTSVTFAGRDVLVPYNCSPNTTTVSNGATLTLEGSNVIRLLPGFTVQPGSFLHARLTDYTIEQNPCFGLPGGRESAVEDIQSERSDSFNEQVVTVYPNPNRGLFTIEADFGAVTDNIEITITSITGVHVFNKRIDRADRLIQEVDITSFTSGIYLIRVSANGGKTVFKRVVKL